MRKHKRKYQLFFTAAFLLISSVFYAQIHCGVVELQSSSTVDANFTFTDFSKYNSGITLLSVARLRVKVENKDPVDLDCSWKLRMFIENNSGAGTLADKWEEITLYGNGNALKPSISDLEVRVNNNCGTPLNTSFRSFTDVNDILDIIEEMVPQIIVPAGSCTANGTKNVNGPGSYLTNYNEYSFDVDLRLKPGFKFNPGVYKLNIKFRLEEVN
ncbi:hypothetical protein [Polaribacter uvawellassae]|uniref:hypothetical protein n=1 Tax=Polaribacter uvawellassae TaxID=3133495 RepID=UPI00321A7A8A